MVWLFWRKPRKTFEEAVKNSFGNIRHDMTNISSWITHFKSKHEEQIVQLKDIQERLAFIEEHLGFTSLPKQKEKIKSQESRGFVKDITSLLDELTHTQRVLCWKTFRLQKENPGKWLTIKRIASEVYPEKGYSQVRTTVSDYLALLEEFDLIERTRKGKQAYVRFKKDLPSDWITIDQKQVTTKQKGK